MDARLRRDVNRFLRIPDDIRKKVFEAESLGHSYRLYEEAIEKGLIKGPSPFRFGIKSAIGAALLDWWLRIDARWRG
jgi:hypothetical protein